MRRFCSVILALTLGMRLSAGMAESAPKPSGRRDALTLSDGAVTLTASRTEDKRWILWGERYGQVLWQFPETLTLLYAEPGHAPSRKAVPGYETVELRGDKLQCRSVLTSPMGNELELVDEYHLQDESIHLTRRMKVCKAAAPTEAFSVETTFSILDSREPEAYFWFAPGYWYGQGEPFFRMNSRHEAGDALDFLCAPIMLCYDRERKLAVSITEMSPGRRKTIAADREESIPGVLVSDQFYLPAMGVRQSPNGTTSFYHTYPGYTHRDGMGTMYRMLPFRQDLERTVVLEFGMDDATDEQQAMVDAWRRVWAQLVDIRMFANPLEARQVLLQYVDRSFNNKYGIAKYMKDVEYNDAESGFLFRNADLAHLMLEAGTMQQESGWVENALEVIQTQLTTGKIRLKDDPINRRPSIEGIHSLLKCWQWAQRVSHDAPQWLETVIREAEPVLEMQEYFSIPLMITLHRVTGEARYLEAAREKGTWSWENLFSKRLFTGGITDCGPQTLDRESAILALEGYLDLYEDTEEACWLEYAVFCADYLETMQMIQDIDMETYGADGTALERRNQHTVVNAAVGNRLSALGLSHITVGGSCGDIYSVYSAPDYYRLYRATGDGHYLEVARMLQYHALQYVNMGEKAGGMADMLYNTGTGFINEFIAMGICSGYVTGRGWAHAENIGWCPYVILSSMQRMYDMTGQYVIPMDAEP